MTVGNVSDYKGDTYFLPHFSKAKQHLSDRGYDSNWFRGGLKEQGIEFLRYQVEKSQLY